jgi:hypothetical protein
MGIDPVTFIEEKEANEPEEMVRHQGFHFLSYGEEDFGNRYDKPVKASDPYVEVLEAVADLPTNIGDYLADPNVTKHLACVAGDVDVTTVTDRTLRQRYVTVCHELHSLLAHCYPTIQTELLVRPHDPDYIL